MSRLSLIIVDDEPDSITVMENLLQKVAPDTKVLAKCTSVEEGIKQIKTHKPDLVLLDVEMPNKNGFDLLRAFSDPTFKVIFITGYDQYAIKAIKFSAVDYLLKPVDMDELASAIERARKLIDTSDGRIEHLNQLDLRAPSFEKVIISSKKGFETLGLNQIVSIESKPGNYAVFSLKDSTQTLATKALNHYEGLFQETNLFRIHRSHMVNLEHVVSFNSANGRIALSDGRELEVAHRRKAEFSSRMKDHFSA